MASFPILRLLPDERCEKRHEFNGGQHVLELIESDVLIRHHCWIVRRDRHEGLQRFFRHFRGTTLLNRPFDKIALLSDIYASHSAMGRSISTKSLSSSSVTALDLTYRFPLTVETLPRLRSRSCIIDGEAVACDDNGVTSFNRVRYRHHDESIFLYAFDLIELNGDDLRRDPLEGRKPS